MNLLPSKLAREIKSKFGSLKNRIAKVIIVYKAPSSDQSQDCPNCYSDTSGVSTGVFDSSFVTPETIYEILITPQSFTRGRCPVCLGIGFLINTQVITVPLRGMVRWNPSSDGEMEFSVAGTEGTNIVQIKTDKRYYEDIRDSDYIMISGVKCELISPPVFRGVGSTDITVVAYLAAVKVGGSVRE
ncbi:MAG TPA: hypothetical protein ENI23_17860 [bacterium]|nr:hypothetical protein [bacterium]